jgi:hypothetical protein
MAGPLHVTIALSDPVEAEDLAVMLAEEHGISAVLLSHPEAIEGSDVILTDGRTFDATTPHLGLGDATDALNLKGRLPEHAEAELIVAAIRVIAGGFRLSSDPDGARTGSSCLARGRRFQQAHRARARHLGPHREIPRRGASLQTASAQSDRRHRHCHARGVAADLMKA